MQAIFDRAEGSRGPWSATASGRKRLGPTARLEVVPVGVKDGSDGAPGGDGVDNRVPEAHQRKHDRGGVGERPVCGTWVGERVNTIGRGRDL